MKLTIRSALFSLSLSALALTLIACEDPSDKVTSAKVNGAKKTGNKAKGKDVEFNQENGSIGFTGSKVSGSHDGGFKTFKGKATIVEESVEKSYFSVTIDMDSTFSDSDGLTKHLKNEDFFDVKKFKESSFESTEIKKDGEKYQVTGNLTLHGVTKSITFPATVSLSKEKLALNAEFSIKRNDFGIVYKGKADNLIRDGVVIRLKFDIKRS